MNRPIIEKTPPYVAVYPVSLSSPVRGKELPPSSPYLHELTRPMLPGMRAEHDSEQLCDQDSSNCTVPPIRWRWRYVTNQPSQKPLPHNPTIQPLQSLTQVTPKRKPVCTSQSPRETTRSTVDLIGVERNRTPPVANAKRHRSAIQHATSQVFPHGTQRPMRLTGPAIDPNRVKDVVE